MFIEAKKLLGLPVAAEETQEKVGEIEQILVDPEKGQLLGFLVQIGGSLFHSSRALSIIDILDWDPNGLVINSTENLVEPKEIVRLNNVLKKKIFLLGMSARTESGKNLGVVENYLIDTTTQTVVKFYLKDLLGRTRIISADKVSRIDKKVYFVDDTAEPPKGAVGAEA